MTTWAKRTAGRPRIGHAGNPKALALGKDGVFALFPALGCDIPLGDARWMRRFSTLASVGTVESITVDDLDRQVAQCLGVDGRASFSAIAEVLGVSDQTVARRYRRLRSAGVLRVVGLRYPKSGRLRELVPPAALRARLRGGDRRRPGPAA